MDLEEDPGVRARYLDRFIMFEPANSQVPGSRPIRKSRVLSAGNACRFDRREGREGSQWRKGEQKSEKQTRRAAHGPSICIERVGSSSLGPAECLEFRLRTARSTNLSRSRYSRRDRFSDLAG